MTTPLVRADTVNGVAVGKRPVCSDDRHQFAAFHGYCIECGVDGWTPDERKATLRDRASVPR